MATHKFTISGTPTAAAGPYPYTITTSGTCSPVTANGTITISQGANGGAIASAAVCSGSSGSVTVTGQSGSITRWEFSTNGGSTWTNIANTTISQAYNNITVPTQYRVLVGNGCGSAYSTVASVTIHNYWTGGTSTDWNVASNWSDNQLPSFASCNTVIIPAGAPNEPQLTSNVAIPNLTIAAGTSLSLNGYILTLNGTFAGSGTGYLKPSATSGLVIGGNASSLFFDPSNNYLKTLTLNNGSSATLGNELNITAGTGGAFGSTSGVLTANGTLTTNGMLTIKSDVNGDARVGPSNGTISGNVTVERYFPPRRAWRFVTAPVNSSQTINAAWQEGQVNTSFYPLPGSSDLYPGFGTEITYDNNAGNGYDLNTTVNPSIRIWNPAINNFDPIPSTYVNINNYPGYYLFVRGSRAIYLSQGIYAPPDPTVLRAVGTLNQVNGNNVIKTSGSLSANQYYFVGNPYASPINLSGILDGTRTSGYNTNMFWVWDPKLSGSFGVGAYVAYSGGIWAPSDGESGGSYAPNDPPVIQSGQAFMVRSDGTSSNISLQFHEADKYPTEASVFGKQQQKNTQTVFYSNLMTPSGNSLTLMDGVASAFGKDNSAGIDKKNASKKWNTQESIGLFRNNTWQAIEFRPIPVLTDTVFYAMYYLKQQNYTLKITTQNVPAGFPQAWLVDKYLNTKTAVVSGMPLLYNFTATSDINTYRSRFMLVFKRTLPVTPIPVTKVINQKDPGTTGNANSMAGIAAGVNVHPNPVAIGGKIILQFNNMNIGKYEVTLTNTLGQTLTEKTIMHDGGSNTYSVQTDARWAAGSYFVKITGEDGYNLITKLVISK